MILTCVMAWTQQDADAVKAAVIALATGTRAYMVTFAGPPERSVQYVAAQLPDLRNLLAEIERSISGVTAFRRASFSKGFDPPRGTGS